MEFNAPQETNSLLFSHQVQVLKTKSGITSFY